MTPRARKIEELLAEQFEQDGHKTQRIEGELFARIMVKIGDGIVEYDLVPITRAAEYIDARLP